MFRRLLWFFVICSSLGAPMKRAAAQRGPSPEVRATMEAIERALDSRSDSVVVALVERRFTETYRASLGTARHVERLKAIRAQLGGMFMGVNIERDPEGFILSVGGAKEVRIRVVLDAQGRITRLDPLDDPRPPARGGPPPEAGSPAPRDAAQPTASLWETVTWDNLNATLTEVASTGWSGVMLARRDNVEVVRVALGNADADSRRPVQPNTVFCIGSQPMDFTITAIMLLGQRELLRLDDPITRFFPDAPADKRAITVRHLLDSKSGLPDFFHDSTDWNADLAYIDRKTAVRRILASPLRFRPGQDVQASHTAFVLLAAVVEVVSGKTYPEFLKTELLDRLGMTRSGFYGETLGLPQSAFAVGPGPRGIGLPNIPPNWGPTSWLIMGSGGMVSTLEDMDKYYAALEAGTLLSGDWAKRQQGPRMGAGGSERGYFIFRASNGRGTNILYLMNGEGRSRENRALTAAIIRLVGR